LFWFLVRGVVPASKLMVKRSVSKKTPQSGWDAGFGLFRTAVTATRVPSRKEADARAEAPGWSHFSSRLLSWLSTSNGWCLMR